MMDCQEAQAVLSTLSDRGRLTVSQISELREHCAGCGECTSFAEGLSRLRATPGPKAPRGLAKRIVIATAAEAERLAKLRAAQEEAAIIEEARRSVLQVVDGPSDLPFGPRWLSRTRLWTITGTVAAAALVIGFAFIASSQINDNKATETAVKEAVQRELGAGVVGQPAAPPMTSTDTASSTADYGVAGAAPAAISWQGKVFVPDQAVRTVNASELTSQGVVLLPGAADQSDKTAYSWANDTSAIVVETAPGTFQVYVPVVRMFDAGTYQLATGSSLQRSGQWPDLPVGMTQPTSADGSPVFVSAGTDALGVQVFTRAGETAAQGIAVPPGTKSSDPAAGNPNWTWWTRLR